MAQIELTKHAQHRLLGRMRGLISAREVFAAVYEAGPHFPVGETAIVAKRLGRQVRVVDPYDGSESNGDMILVIWVRNNKADPGRVATVELRRRSQRPSSRWARILDLTV